MGRVSFADGTDRLDAIGITPEVLRNPFPFGSTAFGDAVCESVRPEDPGTIWIWDHELEGEDPVLTNLIHVCDSFASLLAGDYPPLAY